MSFANT